MVKLLSALISVVALVAVTGLNAQARETGTALGAQAPAFAGADLEGGEVDLAALNAEGKFVMVDFWASWCGPCMGELPNVLSFLKSFDDPRYTMVSCSLDSEETLDALKEVIEEHGIPYPVIYDGGGWKARLAVDWGISSIPATFLINPDGIIVMRNIRGEEGLALVRRIVEEAPDFVPPEFTATTDIASDFSAFTTVVGMPVFPAGDYEFTYGYFYGYPVEDEEPVRVMKDCTIAITITESDGVRSSSIRITTEDGSESSVKCEYREGPSGATLLLTSPLGHEVGYVRIGLDYHDPSLDADLNVAYIYARPAKSEGQPEE